MDIHAPESPIRSFREFATHIAVVTVGILIALGLEGTREALHNRHLVRESRESFRDEMQGAKHNMNDELPRVRLGLKQLQAINDAMPALAEQHPEQVVVQLKAIKNPYYFFSTNSWQAALSTGSLALMPPAEVSVYAWSAEGTRIYVGLQAHAHESQERALAFWITHPHPNADQIAEGMERLQMFTADQESLTYVAPQVQAEFANSLRTAISN